KMKIKELISLFIILALCITLSSSRYNDNDKEDRYHGRRHHYDDGDTIEVVVKVKIPNKHNHHNHHHNYIELDDIQDEKCNRCKYYDNTNLQQQKMQQQQEEDQDQEEEYYQEEEKEQDEYNTDQDKIKKNHHFNRYHRRDVCGCFIGYYGKECRKRELNYQKMFIDWSNQFNKTYSADRFYKVYENFKDSSRFVQEYNKNNETTMELGLTQFSDMTHEEFQHTYLSVLDTSELDESLWNQTETETPIPTETPSPTPTTGPCSAKIEQTIETSWVSGQTDDYIQVKVTITNDGALLINDFNFYLQVQQIWEVSTIGENKYGLPSWISSIPIGESIRFGYIMKSSVLVDLQQVNYTYTSELDESLWNQTETETPIPTETPTPTPTTGPCSAKIEQTIETSWVSGQTDDYIQVKVTITNDGALLINDFNFYLQAQQIWEVSTIGENKYGLPSWISSIPIGGSIRFGYIMKSSVLVDLQQVNYTCYHSNQTETPTNKPGLLKSYQRPYSIDWRDRGIGKNVKNQGECGSCYAFSAIGTLEAHYKNKNGMDEEFSEQQIVDCTGTYNNGGCSGGWMHNAFKYIVENGIKRAIDYPYEGRLYKCRALFKNYSPISSYSMIKQHDENHLADVVSLFGPVAVAYDASTPEFKYYKSGIYDSASCDKYRTTHAVVVLGYGTEKGVDYWIIKNSWVSGIIIIYYLLYIIINTNYVYILKLAIIGFWLGREWYVFFF
ncbi:hypothetical protein DICPUDRAFT_26246, partial [Dictyostelium purpureum]